MTNHEAIWKRFPSGGRMDLVTIVQNASTERITDNILSYARKVFFDGTQIWLLCGLSTYRINPQTNEIISRTTIFLPTGVAFDGNYLWVTTESGRIYRIDPNTGLRDSSIKIDTKYLGPIVFDGEYMWVSISNPYRVVAYSYDIDEGFIEEVSRELNRYPQCLAFDGKYLWVGARNFLYKINTYSYDQEGPYTLSGIDIYNITCYNGIVWVGQGLIIYSFNPETESSHTVLDLSPDSPQGICFDMDLSLWYLTRDTNTITRFNYQSGKKIAQYGVGHDPRDLTFDGTHIWVACHESNYISKIPAYNLKKMWIKPL